MMDFEIVILQSPFQVLEYPHLSLVLTDVKIVVVYQVEDK